MLIKHHMSNFELVMSVSGQKEIHQVRTFICLNLYDILIRDIGS